MSDNEISKKYEEEITIIGITKNFNKVRALYNVNLKVKKGEFLSLLGPSGCGKTTLLRIIAGFEKPDKGKVVIKKIDITNIPPNRRNVSLVFQNYALWPHMTVSENISFGLKLRKINPDQIKKKVEDILDKMNLNNLGDRFPRELSGGQQQRVAVARALALDPIILLMDEPLSNLDRKLRVNMRIELSNLQKDLGITTVYVTHDQEESLSMSDRIAVMNKGEIVQIGTPREIYEKPNNEFIADFMGDVNIFSGEITEINNSIATVESAKGIIFKILCDNDLKIKDKIRFSTKSEKIEISKKIVEGNNVFLGKVKSIDYLGSMIKYFVELEEKDIIITIKDNYTSRKIDAGEKVYIKIEENNFNYFK